MNRMSMRPRQRQRHIITFRKIMMTCLIIPITVLLIMFLNSANIKRLEAASTAARADTTVNIATALTK